ncbi:hypothetical protein BGW38_002121 [Lunasporangiospora selenospora]|uniref:GATA-type domain-containing protein n=1 Tax=Lunasporangiospora selenospora TaxID=979761 RepID=A0A9P6FSH5_9FUNG|nr:hypothetical protein BGW38_002121 [Lunasporangiospora selenospora]
MADFHACVLDMPFLGFSTAPYSDSLIASTSSTTSSSTCSTASSSTPISNSSSLYSTAAPHDIYMASSQPPTLDLGFAGIHDIDLDLALGSCLDSTDKHTVETGSTPMRPFDLSLFQEYQREQDTDDFFAFGPSPSSYLTAATQSLTGQGPLFRNYTHSTQARAMPPARPKDSFEMITTESSMAALLELKENISAFSQSISGLSTSAIAAAPMPLAPAPLGNAPWAHPVPHQQQQQAAPANNNNNNKSTKARKPSKAAIKAAAGMGVRCHNCGATVTPLWRRSANNEPLCNACGLYLKLHATHRPKHLQQSHSQGTGPGLKSKYNAAKYGLLPGQMSEDGSVSGSMPGAENVDGSSMGNGVMSPSSGSNPQPTCTNCKTTLTPLWRKDDAGEILCNACGLYYKLHHVHRPISLKRNVIRRRSRYENGKALSGASKAILSHAALAKAAAAAAGTVSASSVSAPMQHVPLLHAMPPRPQHQHQHQHHQHQHQHQHQHHQHQQHMHLGGHHGYAPYPISMRVSPPLPSPPIQPGQTSPFAFPHPASRPMGLGAPGMWNGPAMMSTSFIAPSMN